MMISPPSDRVDDAFVDRPQLIRLHQAVALQKEKAWCGTQGNKGGGAQEHKHSFWHKNTNTNVKNRVEHTHKRDTAKSNFRDQNVFLQCGYQTFFFVNIFFNQLILNLN